MENVSFSEVSLQTLEFTIWKDSISSFFIKTTMSKYIDIPRQPTKPSLPNLEPVFLSSLGCGIFYIAAKLNGFTVAPNIFFYLSAALSFLFLLLAMYFIWSKDREYAKSLNKYQVKLEEYEKKENLETNIFKHQFFVKMVSGRELDIFSIESHEENPPRALDSFSQRFKAWLEN